MDEFYDEGPDSDLYADMFGEWVDEPDVDELQENEDFAHDNDFMEDQHLDGMYEE